MTDFAAADTRYRVAQVAFETAVYAADFDPAEAAAAEAELNAARQARRAVVEAE